MFIFIINFFFILRITFGQPPPHTILNYAFNFSCHSFWKDVKKFSEPTLELVIRKLKAPAITKLAP